MNLTQIVNEYKSRLLVQIRNTLNGPKPYEVIEAEKVITKYRESQKNAEETIARLSLPLPNPHSCPQCFYLHGKETVMDSLPSQGRSDVWGCPDCNYVLED